MSEDRRIAGMDDAVTRIGRLIQRLQAISHEIELWQTAEMEATSGGNDMSKIIDKLGVESRKLEAACDALQRTTEVKARACAVSDDKVPTWAQAMNEQLGAKANERERHLLTEACQLILDSDARVLRCLDEIRGGVRRPYK